jgi:AraC-like DNA-binding protein
MRPSGQRTRVDLEWVSRGRRPDYHLSPANPVFAHLHHHAEPTSLQVDLHAGFEVGILLTGEQERRIADQAVSLRPGDVWLCAMWEPHGWTVTAPDTREIILIFLPEFLGEEMLGGVPWTTVFSAPPGERPRATTATVRESVLVIGQELWREIEERQQAWLSAVRLGLERLLLAVSRHWRPGGQADRERVPPTTISRIMPALDMIHQPPLRRVSVAEAAAACGLSRSQFDLLFRQSMGMSFSRFGLRARLAFVAGQLLTTELPADAMASRSGFVDASHLHRAFVRHYGCTPAAYRRQFR